MSSSSTEAAGPAISSEGTLGAPAKRAVWRFFNNSRVEFQLLREAERVGCPQSESKFVLLAHDWLKLDYAKHGSKEHQRQLTYAHDIAEAIARWMISDHMDQASSPVNPSDL